MIGMTVVPTVPEAGLALLAVLLAVGGLRRRRKTARDDSRVGVLTDPESLQSR